MRTTALAVGILLMATAVGCAGKSQQQVSANTDGAYTPPASIYSVMDPTSLVYTDVAAGSAANDNPWRWAAFLLYPAGFALDYGLNRPIYSLGKQSPPLFGYT